MAKRRMKARTRRKTGFFAKAKRSVKRYGQKPESTILPSMVYGMARQKVSMMLEPVTAKIPLGNIADELVMSTVTYFLAKKGTGFIKKVGFSGLAIESARLGEAIAQGNFFGMSNNKNMTSQTMTVF